MHNWTEHLMRCNIYALSGNVGYIEHDRFTILDLFAQVLKVVLHLIQYEYKLYPVVIMDYFWRG